MTIGDLVGVLPYFGAAATVIVLAVETTLMVLLCRWDRRQFVRLAVALAVGNAAVGMAAYAGSGAMGLDVGAALAFGAGLGVANVLLWVLAGSAILAPSSSPAAPVPVDHPPAPEGTTVNEKFARAIAHDLKGVARTVSGFTEILLERSHAMDAVQRRDFLERANVAARQLLAMLKELENYAVTLGKNGPCITPRALIDETLELMRDRLGEAMVELHVDVDDGVEVPASLSRVLQNLLDNSVKYAGDDALEIRLTADCSDGELHVQITDNGMGFEPDQVSYIFEPFHRLEPHRERPGLGMGLALCRDVVSKYGGRIWATSAGLGEGATFAFRVPVHKHDEETPNEPTDGVAHRGQRQ